MVTIRASRGRYDLLHPSEESWSVWVGGLKPLLEGVAGVEKFAEREGFSLSIPKSQEEEIEGETGTDLLLAALRAQKGWLYSSDKSASLALLAILEDEESELAAKIERAILESERKEIERRVDRELAALAALDRRLTATVRFLMERCTAAESTTPPKEGP